MNQSTSATTLRSGNVESVDAYPDDIEEKLGFDIVRRRLADFAGSTLGRDAIKSAKSLSSDHDVRQDYALVSEWQRIVESGETVGLGDLPDLLPLLKQCAPEGSWITELGVAQIGEALRIARLVKAYITARKTDYPESDRSCAGLAPDKSLESDLLTLLDDEGLIRDSASAELRKIRRTIQVRESDVRKAASRAVQEAEKGGFAAGDQPTIRGGRIVIPIVAGARRKLAGLVIDSSATGQTVFVEPQECVEANNDLRLLEGRERREIIRILTRITERVRVYSRELKRNQEILLQFDVTRAKSRLGNLLRAAPPDIVDDFTIRIINGRNPALLLLRIEAGDNHARQGVVPLNFALTSERSTVIISGPNAGGKSVAMKTVGLFALMVRHAIPVPADPGTRLPRFEQVLVDIGDEQSLEADLSTFSSHLQRLTFILEHADAKSLVLIDEIGTATDPAAGAAIAEAVLESLTASAARCVATTHFEALKAFAERNPAASNGSMTFDATELAPTYVYEEGLPGSSYAFEIAHRTGFPSGILERARAIVGKATTSLEDLLATLGSSRATVLQKEKLLDRERLEARVAVSEAKEAKEQVDDQRAEILREATAGAASLLAEANRTIEKTIREIKESDADRDRTRVARGQMARFKEKVDHQAKKAKKKVVAGHPTDEVLLVIGDQVVLDDGTTVGIVEVTTGHKATVTFGSMTTTVASKRLRKVAGRAKQVVDVGRSDRGSSVNLPDSLHVRNQLDVRGLHVIEAIPEVDRFIDRAIRAGLTRLDIIHGTGTGALRQAIGEFLRQSPDVEKVNDAPLDEGGAGVTIVDLR